MRVAAHHVYAANMANAETPNYVSKVPHFEVHLDKQQMALP